MDDFLSESIKKKMPSIEDTEIVSKINEWQKEILSKYHIKMCQIH